MVGEIDMLFYATITTAVVVLKVAGITTKKKQSKHGIGGLTMAENKMEMVAAMLGKRLNERFTVDRKGHRFQARFTEYGLDILGEWDNPYIDVNANVLQDLLTGETAIIDE